MKDRIYRQKTTLTAEQIVDSFIRYNKNWWEDEGNGFYNQDKKARKYLMYWAKNGEFGPDYDDRVLISIDKYFSEYLENYELV